MSGDVALAIVLAFAVLASATALAGTMASALRRHRRLQSPKPWRETAADPGVGAAGGVFILLFSAYAGQLLFGIVALCSMLIVGFPVGIIVHYRIYGRTSRGEG